MYSAIHLGAKVYGIKYQLKLIRDEYAIINKRNSLGKFDCMLEAYEDDKGKIYTDEWCLKHQRDCLKNYDLHMEFFLLLNHDKFNKEIKRFLRKYPMFEEIKDINTLKDISGYYVLVLDEYSQVYIGTSQNIYERIRGHWSGRKSFDRLLFPIGAVETSIMSIDSFRALDTTRVLAYKTDSVYLEEDKYISFFSPTFCTNRLSGGRIEGGLMGAIQVLSMCKSRNLKE